MYAINPHTYPQKLWVSWIALLTSFYLGFAAFDLGAATPQAGDFLVIEPQVDGKCQNLSEGGKLVVIHNAHPSQAIAYRLVRTFAGVPQSRVVGVLAPGNQIQALGCSRVDGRDQGWRVERAAFKE